MQTLEERFEAKIERITESGCWIWTSTNNNGYGQIWVNRRYHPAHRVAYEMYVGPIPDGMQIDHLCRVPACCNPYHLEPVTPRENTLRSMNPAAKNAKKTHCPYGHPYDVFRRGWRECKECARVREMERRNKKLALGRNIRTEGGANA